MVMFTDPTTSTRHMSSFSNQLCPFPNILFIPVIHSFIYAFHHSFSFREIIHSIILSTIYISTDWLKKINNNLHPYTFVNIIHFIQLIQFI